MAGSVTKYTEADKARVFVALTANDGNVKRTSRDMTVPENTVRRWKKEWETNGPPNTEALETAVDEFYTIAEDVRLEALIALRERIKNPKTTASALIAVVGVLDDKIARVKGIGSTSHVKHHLVLPTAEEARDLMKGFLREGLEDARKRDEEIIDAEFEEQAPRGALPAGPRR